MPMGRVGAEADIRHHEEAWDLGLDRPHRLRDDTVLRIGPASPLVLAVRQSKEQHGADPLAMELPALAHHLVHRELKLPWHGGDRRPNAFARAHKERHDELVRGKRGLTDQRAQRLVLPHPPRPIHVHPTLLYRMSLCLCGTCSVFLWCHLGVRTRAATSPSMVEGLASTRTRPPCARTRLEVTRPMDPNPTLRKRCPFPDALSISKRCSTQLAEVTVTASNGRW